MIAALALAAAMVEAAPVVQGFEATVPFAPTIALVGGARQLAYELHLTNLARKPLIVDRLEVLDGGTGAPLASFDRAAAAALADSPAGRPAVPGEVAPGTRTILYLNLPVGAALPHAIRHRLSVLGPGGSTAVPLGAVTVRAGRLPTLGPPLRGGPWAAAYDPALSLGHRRYVYAIGGVARVPGRFAIDWFAAGPRRGGEAVLAVADARVVGIRTDMPDDGRPAAGVPLGDATGNYVALDLGGGRFAFYEHLRRVDVRLGQRIRRGQVIGTVGMTGQATQPHLHFHLADAPSPLGAEGLPYRLSGWRQVGRYGSLAALDRGGAWQAEDGPAEGLPPPQAVVRFPD